MTAVDQLYDVLKRVQEPKGYYFNQDRERVNDILAGLLMNRERYGYMCCPCRLASGNRDKDRDIICPCTYRGADVRDYGSCYCNLYVTPAWNKGMMLRVYVPERRPPNNLHY
jgi:ferredoxin-thioredoxin reductase catalytic chain